MPSHFIDAFRRQCASNVKLSFTKQIHILCKYYVKKLQVDVTRVKIYTAIRINLGGSSLH